MASVYDNVNDKLRELIEKQSVFFVATAPSGPDGHVNVSPKGMTGTFAVLGPNRAAYLDYHGSGAETLAHLRQNGRITIMFCAFDGPPKIIRLYGRGVAVPVDSPGYAALLASFPAPPELNGVRSIIDIDVHRVGDSCGYAVPLMTYAGDRDVLLRANERRTAQDLAEYRRTKNATSIDGLPVFE